MNNYLELLKFVMGFLLFLQFMSVLQRELDAVEKEKDAFIHDFSEVGFFFFFFFFLFLICYFVFIFVCEKCRKITMILLEGGRQSWRGVGVESRNGDCSLLIKLNEQQLPLSL